MLPKDDFFHDSVRAAIDALKQSGNLSWLILGDMGEVGNQGRALHHEVGAYAAEQGIEKLFTLGEQSEEAVRGFEEVKKKLSLTSSAEHFTEVGDLNLKLANALQAYQDHAAEKLNILVKGSRFMRMERVAQALLEEAKTCS